jgi:hypothetical protein
MAEGRASQMTFNLRLILTILILAISVSLLVWGYTPNPHEVRVQPISPSEMQLP